MDKPNNSIFNHSLDPDISEWKQNWCLQVQEAGQLEDLGWDGGEAVAVELKNLQSAGQVGEAAGLHQRDPIVVEEPE